MKKGQGNSPDISQIGILIIQAMPIILPAVLACVAVTFMVLLLFGVLYSWLVLLLSVPILLAVCIYIFKKGNIKRPGSDSEQKIFDLLIVVGVILWGVINIYFASQSVFIYRDPAIYSVTGVTLIDNSNLNITVSPEFGPAGEVKHNGAGFSIDTDDQNRIVPQGTRLLPVLIGVAGRIGGNTLALSINSLFGATALIAVYGFARLIAKPRWAALVTAIFAVSLPLIHFSRDTFTEPLLATFTFGGLSLLWLAQKQNDKLLWFLAGLTLGAGVLVRIDGLLGFIGVVPFVTIYLVTNNKDKGASVKNVSYLLGALFFTYILSYLDLTLLGNNYQSATRQKMFIAFAAALLAGAALVFISWSTSLLKLLNQLFVKHKTKITFAVVISLFMVGALLVSRPFWHVGHHAKQIPLVAGLQRAEGEPVDISRDYSEETVNWIAWYIGPVALALGGIGIIVCTVQVFHGGKVDLLPALCIVCGVSLVFLIKPSITPDQIWASRRLLPVILPGVLVFAAVGLDWLGKKTSSRKVLRSVMSVLVVLSVLLPLYVSLPFLTVKTKAGQLSQIESVCNVLPDNGAVLWLGARSFNAIQSVRTFCQVPVARVEKTEGESLNNINKELNNNKKKLIIAVFENEKDLLPANAKITQTFTVNYPTLDSTLHGPPRRTTIAQKTISIAEIK